MARMIPDYIHPDCPSNAEKKLFERFHLELSDSYTVLHSLALAEHAYKLRAEIDFVIVGRKGLLCVEVKGGRIRHENGIWSFIDRFDKVHYRRESPFQQASSAMFSLRKSIRKKFGTRSAQATTATGYCVIFPDQQFTVSSPEWDLRRAVDARNIHRPLQELIEEQLLYAADETLRTSGKSCGTMSGAQKELLVQFLRPDFDLVPSVSTIIRNCNDELLRLTEEQYFILDMINGNERTIVSGGAGTGKTLLATEKARRASSRGEKVLLLCYNRLLATHLRKILRTDQSGGLSAEVYTLHGYAHKVIEQAGLADELSASGGHKVFFEEYPDVFARAFIETFDQAPFDFMIVDEGQDLRARGYLSMMDWLVEGGLRSGRWLWLEDSQQNIFLPPGSRTASAILEQGKPARFQLTRNCRNTRPIGLFNSLATASDRQDYLVDSPLRVIPRYYRSKKHEFSLLENTTARLLGDGLEPDEIIFLSPHVVENTVLAGKTSLSGIRLLPYERNESHSAPCLRHSTIQSFKGLEAVAVIVTDLVDLSSAEARALNYVAFSRPTSYLEVLIDEKAKSQLAQLAYEFGLRN